MRGKFGDRPLQLGIVAVGLADQGARVVGHDQFGNAADEVQRPADAAEPVGLRFCSRRAGVGVVRGAEDSDEDVRPPDLAATGIDDRHGVAGEVDEQFLAGAMGLPHRALQALDILAVELAEARILVGRLALCLPIFFPQQRQRDAVALEFPVYVREVRHDVPMPGAAPVAQTQAALQRLVVHLLQLRPVEPGHLRRLDVLGDDALGNLQGTRNALKRQRTFVLEP